MDQVKIDISLIAISLSGAFIVSKFMRQRRAGILLSVAHLFPPLLVFFNMWAHTVAISAVNIKRILAGTFHYNFTVYSLYLFGITFIILSGIGIHCTRKYLSGQLNQRRNIIFYNLVLSLFFLPVGFINPIGFLPVLTAIFSSLVLLFDFPYRKKMRSSGVTKEMSSAFGKEYAITV